MTTVPPRVYPSRAKPKVDKNCALCGAHFRSGNDRSKFCSRTCSGKANEAKRQAQRHVLAGLDKPYACRHCGTEFMRETRQRVYCTDKCKDAYNGKRRVRIRRAKQGLTDTAICSICSVEHIPYRATKETCGSTDCINKLAVQKRMSPCLGCGTVGQHGKRVADPGYCRTCRPVLRRAPMAIATMNNDYPTVLALMKKRSVITDTGCWEWQGPKTTGGYGCVSGAEVKPDGTTAAKLFVAHRLSLQAKFGRTLGTMQAHHICANRICVNPDHLQPVTTAQNMGEMRARKSYEGRIQELEKALAKIAPDHPLLITRLAA